MSLTWMRRTAILIAILAAACSAPLAAQSYTFDTILYCDGLAAFPYAMNGSGLVVGIAELTSGPSAGMTYFNGKCQTYASDAFYGVTDTGWLIGGVNDSKTYELIVPGSKVTPLPNYTGLQPGNFAYCCMDTSTGTLAGNYWPGPAGVISGFFYQGGKFTSLPWNDGGVSGYWYQIAALNNTGIAVGNYQGKGAGGGIVGFFYQKGKMTYLEHPGSEFTYFQGLNDNEVIVASYSSDDGPSGISLYNIQTATWTDLNFPYPYNDMTPVGISNTGVITLQYSPSGGMVIATPSSN
jgi:hypothetical protein